MLPSIAVPTLVLHARGDAVVPLRQGEQVAEGIPGARLVVLPGADHYLFSGDTAPVVTAVEEFVLGVRGQRTPARRILATVLVVGIVDPTGVLQRAGDARYTDLLDDFDAAARRCVAAGRGEHVRSTGEGFVGLFDGPARAAAAVRDAAISLGVRTTAGLHTSEVERRTGDVTGIGVHLAQRVLAAAGPGEIWATTTVRDLAAGAGLRFVPRGEHVLPGFDRPVPLHEIVA